MAHVCQMFLDEEATRCKENMPPHDNTNWLHRNDMYMRQRICMPFESQESLMACVDSQGTDIIYISY